MPGMSQWSKLVSRFVVVAVLGVAGAWPSGALAEKEPIVCYVYDDNFTNVAGPSDAFYIAGPGKVCIPDGSPTGTCRKWFGWCQTKGGDLIDTLYVFDNDERNYVGERSVYVPGANEACVPDGSARGACRRWFGPSFDVLCYLFDDGYKSMTSWTQAIYYNGRGQVCMPDGSAFGTCRKWFGRCERG